jgi:hypothetical protein
MECCRVLGRGGSQCGEAVLALSHRVRMCAPPIERWSCPSSPSKNGGGATPLHVSGGIQEPPRGGSEDACVHQLRGRISRRRLLMEGRRCTRVVHTGRPCRATIHRHFPLSGWKAYPESLLAYRHPWEASSSRFCQRVEHRGSVEKTARGHGGCCGGGCGDSATRPPEQPRARAWCAGARLPPTSWHLACSRVDRRTRPRESSSPASCYRRPWCTPAGCASP